MKQNLSPAPDSERYSINRPIEKAPKLKNMLPAVHQRLVDYLKTHHMSQSRSADTDWKKIESYLTVETLEKIRVLRGPRILGIIDHQLIVAESREELDIKTMGLTHEDVKTVVETSGCNLINALEWGMLQSMIPNIDRAPYETWVEDADELFANTRQTMDGKVVYSSDLPTAKYDKRGGRKVLRIKKEGASEITGRVREKIF